MLIGSDRIGSKSSQAALPCVAMRLDASLYVAHLPWGRLNFERRHRNRSMSVRDLTRVRESKEVFWRVGWPSLTRASGNWLVSISVALNSRPGKVEVTQRQWRRQINPLGSSVEVAMEVWRIKPASCEMRFYWDCQMCSHVTRSLLLTSRPSPSPSPSPSTQPPRRPRRRCG